MKSIIILVSSLLVCVIFIVLFIRKKAGYNTVKEVENNYRNRVLSKYKKY